MLLTAGATAASAASTIAGGKAAQQSGLLAQQQKEFEALQQEQAAQQSRATAQRSAFEKQREGRLLQSRWQTRDPGNLNLAGDIAARSALQAATAMAAGENEALNRENEASSLRMRGHAARAEADARRKVANLSALGTILGGASSIYRRYNRWPLATSRPATTLDDPADRREPGEDWGYW